MDSRHDKTCQVFSLNDEPRDDLLPPEMDSQLIPAQFLPRQLFGGSHVTPKFFFFPFPAFTQHYQNKTPSFLGVRFCLSRHRRDLVFNLAWHIDTP